MQITATGGQDNSAFVSGFVGARLFAEPCVKTSETSRPFIRRFTERRQLSVRSAGRKMFVVAAIDPSLFIPDDGALAAVVFSDF